MELKMNILLARANFLVVFSVINHVSHYTPYIHPTDFFENSLTCIFCDNLIHNCVGRNNILPSNFILLLLNLYAPPFPFSKIAAQYLGGIVN